MNFIWSIITLLLQLISQTLLPILLHTIPIKEVSLAKEEEADDMTEQIRAEDLPFKKVILIKLTLQIEEDKIQKQEIWKIWACASKTLLLF